MIQFISLENILILDLGSKEINRLINLAFNLFIFTFILELIFCFFISLMNITKQVKEISLISCIVKEFIKFIGRIW